MTFLDDGNPQRAFSRLPLRLLALLLLFVAERHVLAGEWTSLARKISPGMTRTRVEELLPPREENGHRSRPFYETSTLAVEACRLDERWILVVPYEKLAKPGADESANVQRWAAQRVAARPWLLEDAIVSIKEADAPYLRLPWPKGTDSAALHRHGERAEILAGDLFRDGRHTALAVFGRSQEGDIDAFAYYSRSKSGWKLRSLFRGQTVSDISDSLGGIIGLNPLTGNAIPEITLREERGRYYSTYSVFKYDPNADRLTLAGENIADPERAGREVESFMHEGTGSFSHSTYAWVRNRLILRSQAVQTHSNETWIGLPTKFTAKKDEWTTFLSCETRNLRTGTISGWEAFGNIPWLFGGANQATDLWAALNIGRMRRTLWIHPHPEKLPAKPEGSFDFYVGQALFSNPGRFASNTRITLENGRIVRLADVADVEIHDEWPPILCVENSWVTTAAPEDLPPRTVLPASGRISFEEDETENAWHKALHQSASGKIAAFSATQPILLYITGPEIPEAFVQFEVKEEKLAGKLLRIVCTLSSQPPVGPSSLIPEKRSRPAMIVHLGRLEPGAYTARIEFAPGVDGAPATEKSFEGSFRVGAK